MFCSRPVFSITFFARTDKSDSLFANNRKTTIFSIFYCKPVRLKTKSPSLLHLPFTSFAHRAQTASAAPSCAIAPVVG